MKLIPVQVSDELWDRVMALAGGSSVAARQLLEAALERAIRAEFAAIEARHRAEVARQRERFGWRW